MAQISGEYNYGSSVKEGIVVFNVWKSMRWIGDLEDLPAKHAGG